MAIKTYKYNDKSKLSTHFKVSEFKCKCGKNHDILIDSDLIKLLEKIRSKLGASSCNIYSGYRCSSHDKKVGGSGSGPHTKGYAVDCYFIKNGKRINSKDVCLALEDLGHKKGIGYRCGGSKPETGQTHIDTKPRKWYGDESKSMSKSCCSSFYTYFGVKKSSTTTTSVKTDISNTTQNDDKIKSLEAKIKELESQNLALTESIEEKNKVIEDYIKQVDSKNLIIKQKEAYIEELNSKVDNSSCNHKLLYIATKSGKYKLQLYKNESLYIESDK